MNRPAPEARSAADGGTLAGGRRRAPFAGIGDAEWAALEARLGPVHLRQRLGIEIERESRIFGQGINFFHIENWYSVHGLIRGLLRISGLHARGRRNARRIELRENEVVLPGLAAAFDGYSILHLSDVHLDMGPDMADVLAARVADLSYDLCVITGDFRARTFGPHRPAVEAMARVRRVLKGPVYAVLGNHDSIRMATGLEAMGIELLFNEHRTITRSRARFHLLGIDDPHYYRADNLEKALLGVDDSGPKILLSHSPEIFRHAAHAGIDLMLCGHTHGGQICLPGQWPLLCNARSPRALCRGAWRHHGMQGYTSAGSGACIVDVRLNCPAEVTLHRLRPLGVATDS